MSLVKVRDPRVEINAERTKVVYECSREAQRLFVSSTNPSSSAILFNIRPPQGVIIDRTMEIDLQLTLTFTGTCSAGGKLINIGTSSAGGDSIRFLPFTQICTSATATINNSSVNFVPYQCNGLYRCISDADLNSFFSLTGSMPDQYQQYFDATTLGVNRNPMISYGVNSYMQTRASLYYNVVSNAVDATSAVVQVEISEPIMIPPFLYGKNGQMRCGLANIQTLDINFVLGNLQRFWSHCNVSGAVTSTISAVSAVVNKANMLLTYISPYQDNRVEMDKHYLYQNYRVVPYKSTNQATSLAAGSSATLALGAQTYGSIPSKLFIFVEVIDANKSLTTADAFAYISQLTITWNNRTNLLASASAMQLYKMSIENGLNMSFAQWQTYVGSIIIVDVAKDIGLDNFESVGMLKQIQYQVQATFTNPSNYNGLAGVAISYNLVCIPIFSGYVAIKWGECQVVDGDLTQQDIMLAMTSPDVRYAKYNAQQIFNGGSFWDDAWSGIKNVGRKTYDFGRKAYDAGRDVVSGIRKGVDVLRPALSLIPGANTALGAYDLANSALKSVGVGQQGGYGIGGMTIGGRKMQDRRYRPKLNKGGLILGGNGKYIQNADKSILEKRLARHNL